MLAFSPWILCQFMPEMEAPNGNAVFSPTGVVMRYVETQTLRAETTKNQGTFYRNVKEALNARRATHSLYNTARSN